MKRIIIPMAAAAATAAGCSDKPFDPDFPPVAGIIQRVADTGSPFRGVSLDAIDEDGIAFEVRLDVTAFAAAGDRDAAAPLTLTGALRGVDGAEPGEAVHVILAADVVKLSNEPVRACAGPVQIEVGIAVDNPDLRAVAVDNPDLIPAGQLAARRVTLDASDMRNRGRAAALICRIARALEDGEAGDVIAQQLNELLEALEAPETRQGAQAAFEASLAHALAAVEDALDRVVPALAPDEDDRHARAVEVSLRELHAGMATASERELSYLLAAASAAVERHARAGPDADRELDVIRLALKRTETAVAVVR